MTFRTFCFTLSCLSAVTLLAQDTIPNADLDRRYREDQFYVGVTYNLLSSVPANINLRGVSGGIHFGFLRDMPLNERRNVALAIGGGVAFDRYGYNLFIGEDGNEQTIFSALTSEVDFDSSSFSTATVEAPFEIRWRSSTAASYKFWRVYGGIRVGYTYWYRALFVQPNNEVSQTDIPEFEPVRLAATLSFGYSTFNFYAYYSINPFFKDAVLEDTNESLDFRTLKLGVVFYLL